MRNRIKIIAIIVIFITVFLSACSDSVYTAFDKLNTGPVYIPITGVTLNKSATTILADSTELLTAAITPADATSQNLIWTTDNDTIAEVSANGLVTGIDFESAVITVTTEDGSFTDTCTVTVIGGVLDTTFNSIGYTSYHNAAGGNGDDRGNDIIIDSNGKILVCGYSYRSSNNFEMVIWRYNNDGSLDTTFNSTGFVVHNRTAGTCMDSGTAIAIDGNQKILVTGRTGPDGSNGDMTIWRYNSNGTLDTSFNSVGYVTHHNAAGGNGSDNGDAITVDQNGKILVTGCSNRGPSWGDWAMAVWRYNDDGSFDTTFSSNGYLVYNNTAGGNDSDRSTGIVVDAYEKIVVSGYSWNGSNNDMVIWRFNDDGSFDTTFNSVGYIVHNGAAGGSGNDAATGIVIDENGKIIVSGTSRGLTNTDIAIWRYNNDGSPDTTFNSVGYAIHNNENNARFNNYGYDITLDANGKILVCGVNRGSIVEMTILRYNTNGTLDTTFNFTGYVVHDSVFPGNTYNYGTGIAVDGNENIFVVGSCSQTTWNYDMVLWCYK